MGKSRKGALCNQLYQYRANSFVVSLFWNACFAYEETDCDKTFPFFNPLMIKLSRLYNATEFLHWWMYTHISLAYKCRCPFKIVATVKSTRTMWSTKCLSSTSKTKAWMRAKKAGFKIVATVKSRTGNVLSKTMWGQNAQLQTRSKTWAKNRTNKFEKISDAKPILIIQATLTIHWFEDDFTNIDKWTFILFTLLIKMLLSSVSDMFYSFPIWMNILSDFLNNNVAASTLPYWSCFSTGSCPLVWRENLIGPKICLIWCFGLDDTNWSKNLLLSNVLDWLIR